MEELLHFMLSVPLYRGLPLSFWIYLLDLGLLLEHSSTWSSGYLAGHGLGK